jgi:LacI family transcriptional regulator
MPTIRDVAHRAGVAPITVSRVINNTGYISDETRARVEAAIAELQYVPNSLSQSLRFKKTNTISLIVSDITNPFWTVVTRGAEDASSERGLNVILCNSDENESKQDRYVNVLLQRQTDGFLLVPASNNGAVVKRIKSQRVPLVVIDRQMRDVEVDIVRCDSEGGAFHLTQYLLNLGHRRIAILTGPQDISTSEQRVTGYKNALRANGLTVDERLIHYGHYNQDAGYDMANKIIQDTSSPRPTALFAGNNLIAIGILKALDHLGLQVPEDISVVSFDDLPLGLLTKPFLTVMAQSAYQVGYQAAQLLLKQIAGEEEAGNRDMVLPVELIERQSCRALTDQ